MANAMRRTENFRQFMRECDLKTSVSNLPECVEYLPSESHHAFWRLKERSPVPICTRKMLTTVRRSRFACERSKERRRVRTNRRRQGFP
jgi:hypothetical protein